MTTWLLISAGVLLVALNGLFVAAEFSLVALDPSHVDDPKGRGKRVVAAHKTLSTQLSSAQVGITVTAILLGYVGQPALTQVLVGPLEATPWTQAAGGALAGGLSFTAWTLFQMIFGELFPKNAAIAKPMATARAVAPFQLAFTALFKVFIVSMNGTANAVLRLMGIEPREELRGGRSRQELAALVRRSAMAGTLAPSTALLLKNTIELDDLTAIDVMTDRTRMVSVDVTGTAADVLAASRASGHSRFPVVGEGPDDVVGMVHVRQAIGVPAHERDTTAVSTLMVEAPRVPETLQMRPLLLQLRDLGHQCAVVVDEYGGTAGLVTLEDVVEELVGDVADEHDRRRPAVYRAPGGAWIVPGELRPDEVFEVTELVIPESPAYETLGGFVMAQLGRVAEVGDTVESTGVLIRVERMDGRRIDRVRLTPVTDRQDPS